MALAVLALMGARCSEESSEDAALQVMCPAGQEQEMECVSPGQTVQGSKLPATWDQNNCQVLSEVRNSCCRPAQAGPVLRDGKCCYAFCGGVCC